MRLVTTIMLVLGICLLIQINAKAESSEKCDIKGRSTKLGYDSDTMEKQLQKWVYSHKEATITMAPNGDVIIIWTYVFVWVPGEGESETPPSVIDPEELRKLVDAVREDEKEKNEGSGDDTGDGGGTDDDSGDDGTPPNPGGDRGS